MTSALSQLRQTRTQSFWAALVLFAYLFKAIIPLGYMPDTKALEQGMFNIVICTTQGATHLLVDSDGLPAKPSTGQHEKAKSEACPYSFGGLTVFTAAFAPLFIPFSYGLFTHALLPFSSPDEIKRYGNASPRSPPAAA